MDYAFTKLKSCKAVQIIIKALQSKFFPFVAMAVSLLCYYLSLDIVTILYLAITTTLIVLLLDDLSPMISNVLFFNVFISWDNSPATGRGHSDYYLRPEILIPIIIVAVILGIALIYRFILTCVQKRFKFTPVFFGFVVFCVSLLLNGVTNKDYVVYNLVFAAMLTLALLGIFALVKDNVKVNKDSLERVALGFIAFGILLVVELAVIYATNDVFAGGSIDRYKINFGWGVYTRYGALLTMCIPATFYLAHYKKYGFVYTALSFIFLVAVIFSCCRQAMVTTVIIYPVCALILIIKGQNRIANACVLAAAAICGIVVAGLFQNEVFDFFKTIYANVITNGELNGSGRMELWRNAIADFKAFPVFGRGFYKLAEGEKLTSFTFPHMYHNTVLEMMGSCGIIGLLAYTAYSALTTVSYCKKITIPRTFIALTVLTVLINSLLDNHIFNIVHTMAYSFMIALLVKSEKEEF